METKCREIGCGEIATLCGRYYAMDRDKRWERTERAYKLLVNGEGERTDDPVAAIKLHAQLMEDVRNDITRFEPFFADAVRVLELDKKRNASLALVSGLSPREHADAIARMQENTLIVQWVQQCLEQRISSYRWALERLVIQAPDNIAADADRLIGELAAQTANPPVAAQPVIGRALSVRG